MLTDVTMRLSSFGYTVTTKDSFTLGFIIAKVQNTIKSDCNLQDIPVELNESAVDMVVGEFLMEKKASADGLLGFDLDIAEKSIQEGDTKVDFAVEASQSPEQRLDSLITFLLTPRQSFASFRRIRW